MKRLPLKLIAGAVALLVSAGASVAAGPKGAKAIFDSGEGSSISASAVAPKPGRSEPVADAKPSRYAGISYQILQMMDDGSMRPVSQARTFRNGERVKIIARTNRPGYLTVMNVGPTGNTSILFNDYVEPFKMVEVPRGTNLKFVGEPGTERLLFMLSNEPNPMAGGYQNAANVPPNAPPPANLPPQAPTQAQYSPPPTSYSPPPANLPPPATSYPPSGNYPPAGNYPPVPPDQGTGMVGTLPSPPTMVASIDGAKTMKGGKDMVVEDQLQSSYTVISPRNAYKPVASGTKDLVVESSPDGFNYGVLPVSAIAGGGILTLDVNLKHR